MKVEILQEDYYTVFRKGDESLQLYELLQTGSAFEAADRLESYFRSLGFLPYHGEARGKFFVRKRGFLTAFSLDGDKMKLAAAHLDSPTYRLKALDPIVREDVPVLNVEVYGGPIHLSFWNRPLGLSGVVAYEKDGAIAEETVVLHEPVAIFLHQAIHMERTVNDGLAVNPQKELPVYTGSTPLRERIAKELGTIPERILGTDLFLYDLEGPVEMGDYLLSPRLDDLAMAYAIAHGMQFAKNAMAIFYNHEEIGSLTDEGAESPTVFHILRRIAEANGTDVNALLDDAFLMSADMAHAVHPDHPETHDPVYRPSLDGGITLKIAANGSYTTHAETEAVVRMVAKRAGVPVQTFYNASDRRGGSTIGPLRARTLPVASADIGIAMLSMHAAREYMARVGITQAERFFRSYFEGALPEITHITKERKETR